MIARPKEVLVLLNSLDLESQRFWGSGFGVNPKDDMNPKRVSGSCTV